jgi:hypothetical protein
MAVRDELEYLGAELASWAVLEGGAKLAGNYFVPDKCGCQ